MMGAALAVPVASQSSPALNAPLAAMGGEYSITGGAIGDQINPSGSFGVAGGYVAWQDNNIDGDGWGIAAVRLDQSLSPAGGIFRVNAIGVADQTSPKVASLANGGAVFVWQGGASGATAIYARFLKPGGGFTTTSDILVNSNTSTPKITPSVAVLTDGSVIVVWASYGQDDAKDADAQMAGMLGVYGQRLDASGNKLGGEFLVNQTVVLNQRSPVVAALADGGYAVAWVGESVSEVGTVAAQIQGVNVFFRRFAASGAALGDETQANDHLNPCAAPALGSTPDGGFTVAWVERDMDVQANGFDIVTRSIPADGIPSADSFLVNSYVYGDQFAPQIASKGELQHVVWLSDGEEGFRQGVYGRFLRAGSLASGEARVNTTTSTVKENAIVASGPGGGFLALWDSFVPAGNGYEIFAQRLQNDWPTLAPHAITALATNQLAASWSPLAGFAHVVYQIYLDGNPPVSTTYTNWTTPAALAPGSLHSFRLGYMASGVASPTISSPASGATPGSPVAAGQVETVTETAAGSQLELSWATVAGVNYQLQFLSNGAWVNLGAPRLAAAKTDYVFVKGKKGSVQYRVVKL